MLCKNLAIFISGRGSNMEALIKASLKENAKFTVKLVFSDNPNALGLKIANALSIKTNFLNYEKYSSKKIFEEEIYKILKKNKIDIIALAGYMRIISPYLINKYKDLILNIHPSLLPKFKGLNPQQQALNSGVKTTGCTVHLVSEIVDSGPIIAQANIKISANDTVSSLSERILKKEHILYSKALNNYIMEKFYS